MEHKGSPYKTDMPGDELLYSEESELDNTQRGIRRRKFLDIFVIFVYCDVSKNIKDLQEERKHKYCTGCVYVCLCVCARTGVDHYNMLQVVCLLVPQFSGYL